MNLATIATLTVVAVLLFFAVRSAIRSFRGPSKCSGCHGTCSAHGCPSCPSATKDQG